MALKCSGGSAICLTVEWAPTQPGPEMRGRWSHRRLRLWRPLALISPEVAEPVRRKLGITDSVLNILVAEIVLQGAGIVPIVGKLIPAGMP